MSDKHHTKRSETKDIANCDGCPLWHDDGDEGPWCTYYQECIDSSVGAEKHRFCKVTRVVIEETFTDEDLKKAAAAQKKKKKREANGGG